MACIDRHAPLRHKRVGNKRSPWISQLQREMRKRDYLKQKAIREDNIKFGNSLNTHVITQIILLKLPNANIL